MAFVKYGTLMGIESLSFVNTNTGIPATYTANSSALGLGAAPDEARIVGGATCFCMEGYTWAYNVGPDTITVTAANVRSGATAVCNFIIDRFHSIIR